MSAPTTMWDLVTITGGSGTVLLLVWAMPRLLAAAAHAIAVGVALWHPDKSRRAEATRLVRQIGAGPLSRGPRGERQ